MNIRTLTGAFSAFIVIVIGSTVISACTSTSAEGIADKIEVAKTEVKPIARKENPKQDDEVEEVRDVSGFTKVSVGGTISSTITVGESFRVVVRTEQDMLEKIKTTVKNGKLRVGYERGYWNNKRDRKRKRKTKVHVTISLPSMEALDISGASKSSVTGVQADKFDIDISGASVVDLSGTANDVDIDVSGASVLNGKQFFTQFAEIDLSGASNTKLNVSTELRVDASGASSVQYIGNPKVSKSTSGASSVSQRN